MSNKKGEEKEDELINDLEDFIECLREITDTFNQVKNPNYEQREEVKEYYKFQFFNDYINLEDNILSTFAKIKTSENERIANLITQFNNYWNDYQDTWSEEYWQIFLEYFRNHYEKLRKSRDKNLGFAGVDNSNLDNQSNFSKSNIMRSNTLNLINELKSGHKEESKDSRIIIIALSKIDEELKNGEENTQIKDSDKKRGCIDCIVY